MRVLATGGQQQQVHQRGAPISSSSSSTNSGGVAAGRQPRQPVQVHAASRNTNTSRYSSSGVIAADRKQVQVHATSRSNNTGSGLIRPVRPVKMSRPGIPKIVALDLDGTIWVPEMYQLSGGAPFRRDSSGAVYDSAGERIRLLGDTMKIIQTITLDPEWADTQIAYVSRTEYPEWAIPCLQQFPIPGHPRGLTLYDVGMYQEIYPGSKLKHFKVIHQASGVDYEDMLFFDNERWNTTEVSRLGVKSVYTPRGMTSAAWQQGLQMCAEAAGGPGGGKKQKASAAAKGGSRAY